MSDPLTVEDLEEAAEAVAKVAGREIHLFERVVGEALQGKVVAVAAYLGAWKTLEEKFLDHARELRPDFVIEHEGQILLVDVKGRQSEFPKELLDLAAVNAPFSPFVARFGVGKGVALYLLSEVRRSVPELDPLIPDRVMEFPGWDISQQEFNAFVRRVLLHEIEEQPPLQRIVQVFDISDTELASLFGVKRQAVAPWLQGDIPAKRLSRIETIAAIADVLERNLNTHAIPGVFRRAADAYGGHSILEMIRQGDEDFVLTDLQRTFDWAITA